MFKKIWKDPVGSQIIAGLILIMIGFCGTSIYSIYHKESVSSNLKLILTYKVPVYYFLIILFSLIIIAFCRFLIVKYFPKEEKLKRNFIRTFNKIYGADHDILIRFEITFNDFTNLPEVKNVRMYCTAHEGGLLMLSETGCVDENCKKYFQEFDIEVATVAAQKTVTTEWDKINN